MSFQDKYIETNEIDIFKAIEWGQSFEKNPIEQPDIPDYGERAITWYTTQVVLGPVFFDGPNIFDGSNSIC